MVMIGGGFVKAGVLKRMHKRIKNFMNMIILVELKKYALTPKTRFKAS